MTDITKEVFSYYIYVNCRTLKRVEPNIVQGKTSFVSCLNRQTMEIVLVAAAAAFGFATAAGSLEGVSTAAARYCMGLIDAKSGTHQAVNVVNFATIDITKAHLIDEHFEFTL